MNRVTATSGARMSLANIQNASRSRHDAQEKISSGKQVRKPSDGPAQVLSALDYRAQIRRNQQLERNILDARAWLDTADSALTHSVEQLTRAKSLLIGAVNGSADDTARLAYAAEIEAIAETLLQTANTQYLGRPIFGGTNGETVSYAPDGTYQGNNGEVQRSIAPAVEVRVNRTGPEIYGADAADPDQPMTGNVFQMLHAVAAALRAGDMATANAGLSGIDGATETISRAQVEMGARGKQVEEVRMRNHQVEIDLKFALAEVEDTDMIEAIITLQSQEMAYQGALAVTAKIIQPTLLDFLR